MQDLKLGKVTSNSN